MGSRGHDNFVGALECHRAVGQDFKQFITSQISQVIASLHAVFAECHLDRRRHAVDILEIVLDAEFLTSTIKFLVLGL